MGTREEEELGGGTTFCSRVVGFWPLTVALEILQAAPLLIVHKFELGSVWLPKIAFKKKKREKISVDGLDNPFAVLERVVCSSLVGQKEKENCYSHL